MLNSRPPRIRYEYRWFNGATQVVDLSLSLTRSARFGGFRLLTITLPPRAS